MPKITRILLYGNYITPLTQHPLKYELRRQDDEVYLVIEEGKPFITANQNRPYIPISIPNKTQDGNWLICQQFDDNGNIIDSFPLYPKKLGLWALTPEAARNGIFHKYKIPQNPLQKELQQQGISRQIIHEVPDICHLMTYGFISANRFSTFYGDTITPYPESTEKQRLLVEGHTFLIIYTIDNPSKKGQDPIYIHDIFITKNVDYQEVIHAIKTIRK